MGRSSCISFVIVIKYKFRVLTCKNQNSNICD